MIRIFTPHSKQFAQPLNGGFKMTKLHPETAQQIAHLFTGITVSKMMANDGDNVAFWMADEYRKIIKLADTFGIILPSCDLARENLEKPHFKNAVLK